MPVLAGRKWDSKTANISLRSSYILRTQMSSGSLPMGHCGLVVVSEECTRLPMEVRLGRQHWRSMHIRGSQI